MAQNVDKYINEGYRIFQLKVGGDPNEDIARIRAVRKLLDKRVSFNFSCSTFIKNWFLLPPRVITFKSTCASRLESCVLKAYGAPLANICHYFATRTLDGSVTKR